MNHDLERQMISVILRTGDYAEVVKSRITTPFFYGQDKMVFRFIDAHYREHRTTPAVETVKTHFPDFEVVDVVEPMDYYANQLRKRHKYTLMAQTIRSIGEGFSAEGLDFVEGAEKALAEMVSRLAVETGQTKTIDSNRNIEDKIARYEAAKLTKGITGVRLGIPALDEDMGGAKPGHFITVVAKQKTGKTWFEVVIAANANREGFGPGSGARILFLTQEMEAEEIDERADAVRFGLPYGRLLRGELGAFQEESYYNRLEEMAKNPNMPPFIIARAESFTWTEIQALIEEHTPDLVIVDGIYLLDPEDSSKKAEWERLKAICDRGKKIAQRMGVPIVVTTQFGKDATKNKKNVLENLQLENIAFAYNAFGAFSDWVIALYDTDELKLMKRLGVLVLAARRRLTNKAHHFHLTWDLNDDIGNIGKMVRDFGEEEISLDDEEDVVLY